MSITRELGLRIRSYRKKKGLSQEELAELCSLHPTYIGQLERGEKNATVESLYKISQGLDLPLSTLFSGVEEIVPGNDDLSFSIYRKLQNFSPEHQREICEILDKMISLIEK